MRLTWDPDVGRYRRENGRVLSLVEVRRALDADAANLADYAKLLADQVVEGRISLDQWRGEMRTLIKQTHLTAAAMAKGGRAQLTPSDFGRVGQIVKTEYQRLDGWVTELIAGVAPADGRMRPRAAMYAQAGRHTYHQIEAREMLDRGLDEERSVLHPAEHCGECLAEAAAGWRPIGLMIPIGSRTCLRNCRCGVEYRRARGD